MTSRPTSMRLTDAEIELLDAIADHLSDRAGYRVSRADALRSLLKRAKPGTGADAARWRDAYKNVFD